jgi:tripartite-type tricarboxylate transporter receptor subunit TctC
MANFTFSLATRRGIVATALLFLACVPAKSQPAAGGDWPGKPVRIVSPFTPGGSSERLSRLLAQRLQEHFKQSFVIDSRPGAGGVIGSELVVRSAPDGYTLLLSSLASQVIAPVVQKTPYDGLRDFTHIAVLGGPPTLLVAGPGLEVKDIREFIARAKSKPGSITYGTPGNGTHGHLIGELLRKHASIEITHVPYKGAGPVNTDLIGGHLPAASITLSSVAPQLKAGKLRGLASTAARRTAEFPDIPTYAESGFPELTAITWFGISGPAGMPANVVTALNREIRRAMQSAEIREALRPEGFEILELDPAQTLDYFRRETERWQPVARASSAGKSQ